MRGMARTKLALLLAACSLALLSLPVAGFLGFNWLYVKWEESHDVKFDQMLWDSGSRERIFSDTALRIDASRIRMCRDFIANQPWRGKTKKELETWRGKPGNFPFCHGWDFNCWVGLQRGPMKLDSCWLCFRFDEAGRATDAVLKQD